MVQYAVTLKDGDWTVFTNGNAIEHGLSRSAAIQMAKDLAFDAEERGETVEQQNQNNNNKKAHKLSGGGED